MQRQELDSYEEALLRKLWFLRQQEILESRLALVGDRRLELTFEHGLRSRDAGVPVLGVYGLFHGALVALRLLS